METPQGPFCQSCAMPMTKDEDFGTEADGSKSQDYCHYCYQNGAFVNPNMTCEEMVEFCANKMKEMNMPEETIAQTKTFIPTLKRWQS